MMTRVSDAEIMIENHVGISGAAICDRKNFQIADRTDVGGNVKIIHDLVGLGISV